MSEGHGLVRLIGQRRVLWIDAETYGRRLLMGGAAFPWCDTAAFVQGHARLNGLARSDVVALDVGSFFESWIARYPLTISGSLPRGRVALPLTQLLGDTAARKQFADIATAVRHSFKQVLALELPPFGAWIEWAHDAGSVPGEGIAIDDDAIDDVAVAAADFMRCASSAGIDTLLINESEQLRISVDQPDLYAPLTNLARHYHWDAGLRRHAKPTPDGLPAEFDYVIARGITRHLRFDTAELPAEFWSADAAPCEAGLLYAQVPPDATPEQVVARLGVLQRLAGTAA